jgi:hypothetical protein
MAAIRPRPLNRALLAVVAEVRNFMVDPLRLARERVKRR